jgi:hypothetical protein
MLHFMSMQVFFVITNAGGRMDRGKKVAKLDLNGQQLELNAALATTGQTTVETHGQNFCHQTFFGPLGIVFRPFQQFWSA